MFYGNGFANRMIGKVLPEGDRVVVASKVGADPQSGGPIPMRLAQRPEQLRATVEENLLSLGMEQIALVNLRRTDMGPGLRAEGDQMVDIDDQMAEMIAMRKEGKIGSIGLSAVSLENVESVLSAGIACVQNAYSLVDRDSEGLLALCLKTQYRLGAILSPGRRHAWYAEGHRPTQSNRPCDAARNHSITTWPRLAVQHSPNTLLIPGTTDIEHLEENLAVGSVVLSEDLSAQLNKLSVTTKPA